MPEFNSGRLCRPPPYFPPLIVPLSSRCRAVVEPFPSHLQVISEPFTVLHRMITI